MTYVPFVEAFTWLVEYVRGKRAHAPVAATVPVAPSLILLVEDNPNDVELVRFYFRSNGREIKVATTAEAARVYMERNHLALVLIDMNLPHQPGWELVPDVWRLCPDAHVVIACGALVDVLRIERPDSLFSVLLKPLSVDKVRRLLAMVRV